jgi:hypothetical protein
MESSLRLMADEPVFADVYYGGAPLNRGLFLPKGVELAVTILPYNGGRLTSDGFSLVEFYKEGSNEGLEGLVVRSDPPLTAAERAALRQVPAGERGRNVGPALPSCRTTWWAVGVVAATLATAAALQVAAAAGVTWTGAIAITGGMLRSGREPEHLDPQEIAQLGPAASARRLLALRRDAIGRRRTSAR